MIVWTGTRRRDYISLASLHWLVKFEIKILFLRFKVVNGLAPSNLKNLIVPYYSNWAFQTSGLLVVPRISRSRMGGSVISYAALGSGCCYRFLPAKWEIFLPTVSKCLFTEVPLIFRGFFYRILQSPWSPLKWFLNIISALVQYKST